MSVFRVSSHRLTLWRDSHCSIAHQLDHPILSIAIDLAPQVKGKSRASILFAISRIAVIGGHAQCVEAMSEMASDYNVKLLKRVNVSGAFHTKLMIPASIALRKHLASVCLLLCSLLQLRQPSAEEVQRTNAASALQLYLPSVSVSHQIGYGVCPVKCLFFSTHVQAFVDCLAQQVSHTVKWEQILHAIYDKKLYTVGEVKPRTYELGPGDQLCAVLKR